MCGIAGFLRPGGFERDNAEKIVDAMTTRIAHRGPDDAAVWLDSDAGIALGHRRLAIVDLSTSGRQPMVSASGRYVLIFNGEIYNHVALRKALNAEDAGQAWRGHSDTETLLAAIERWGITACLKKCVGMFALALWDREQRALTLTRDRLGEKPLYFGWQNTSFLFASELKALRAHPSFQGQVDRQVIARYLDNGYIRAPHTIYKDIYKLEPGCLLRIDKNCKPGEIPDSEVYWSLQAVAEAGLAQPFTGSRLEATDFLHTLLRESIALQRVADVPLGAFLSGGIDSSTVVALMQEAGGGSTKTFTIGFEEAGYNEAGHAKVVAEHLGTDHTELYVTPREVMEVIPLLPSLYDEPFGDSSAIPTYLVSALARQSVTVSLSGDGGDELFGGYTRYARAELIWSKLVKAPQVLRRAIATTLRQSARLFGSSARATRMVRIASYLDADNINALYTLQTQQRLDSAQLVLHARPTDALLSASDIPAFCDSGISAMMYFDTLGYLPDDILTKVDRASMAVSLESRVPLLDHRIVEFAWQLPLDIKRGEGSGKKILKDITHRYLPASIMDRPKAGFGVPVGDWIRGPLREWAESLLSEEQLRRDGFFDATRVRQQWQQHLNRPLPGDERSWQLLMFQAWLEASKSDSRASGVVEP